MFIKKLKLTDFRNFSRQDFEFSPKMTLIHGPNGVGKTSILEAVALCGLGRSFRTTNYRRLIKHEQEQAIIYSELVDPAGIIKKTGIAFEQNKSPSIHIDEQKFSSFVPLAKIFPVQIINHQGFMLIEGGPKERRQFIDWCLFYSEPSFHKEWQAYSHALKQRNSALRNQASRNIIAAFHPQLEQSAARINEYRKSCLSALEPLIQGLNKDWFDFKEIRLTYKPGWDDSETLGELLQRELEQPYLEKTTTIGPHRADIELRVDGQLAKHKLSRGQTKQLFCLLQIARSQLVHQKLGKIGVVLLDDLNAELDKEHRAKVLAAFQSLNAQIILTSLEAEDEILVGLDYTRLALESCENQSLPV